MNLSQTEKEFLLSLSRQTLEKYFLDKEKLVIDEKDLPDKFKEKTATFISLLKNGEIRGCAGQILAKFPLYKDIINNTLLTAFSDPRFPQLTEKELSVVKIEISILTLPKRIIYDDLTDLVGKIVPKSDGIILQSGFSQATFLPDSWKDFPKVEDFLSNLSLKAGLTPTAWKNSDVEFFSYETENFSEVN